MAMDGYNAAGQSNAAIELGKVRCFKAVPVSRLSGLLLPARAVEALCANAAALT